MRVPRPLPALKEPSHPTGQRRSFTAQPYLPPLDAVISLMFPLGQGLDELCPSGTLCPQKLMVQHDFPAKTAKASRHMLFQEPLGKISHEALRKGTCAPGLHAQTVTACMLVFTRHQAESWAAPLSYGWDQFP